MIKQRIGSSLSWIDRWVEASRVHLPHEVNARNTLIFCVISLLCIGTMMVISASMPYSERISDNPYGFLTKQFMFIVIALMAFLLASSIRMRYWFGKVTVILWLLTAVLLLAVLLVGKNINGSVRWLSFSGFNFQVSELAKFTMVLFCADYVVRRAGEVRESLLRMVTRLALPVGGIVTLIVIEPDLGASVVVVMSVATIIFLAGAPMRALASIFAVIFVFLAGFIALEPFRLKRLLSFSDPWSDVHGTGYQLAQSLMAFGRGEWLGTGLGQSIQKLSYLPEAHTDFMLAITAEELGFVGISVIFSLSFLMVACCMRIAHRALFSHHLRSGYLAYGIATIFLLQICVNAGMNMGLIPTKGLTMPFISYGGSSLVVCAFMIGVMLRIEREIQTPCTDGRT